MLSVDPCLLLLLLVVVVVVVLASLSPFASAVIVRSTWRHQPPVQQQNRTSLISVGYSVARVIVEPDLVFPSIRCVCHPLTVL